MIRKHSLPFLAGVVAWIVAWVYLGPLIHTLTVNDALKGFLIVTSAVLAFGTTYNFLSKRAKRTSAESRSKKGTSNE